MVEWDFSGLELFSYGFIMSDDPWQFNNYSEKGEEKNASAHYKTIPTNVLKTMPVGHLASRDAWLWQWATHPMMDDAMEVVKARGFKIVTTGVWVKQGKSGKLAFGTGYVLRCASEPFIIAKVGNPPLFSKSVRTAIVGPRGRHSEKPSVAYRTAEKLFGDVKRIELFSRSRRPGWDNWGDQSNLFDAGQPVSTKRVRAAEKAATRRQRDAEPTPLLDLIG